MDEDAVWVDNDVFVISFCLLNGKGSRGKRDNQVRPSRKQNWCEKWNLALRFWQIIFTPPLWAVPRSHKHISFNWFIGLFSISFCLLFLFFLETCSAGNLRNFYIRSRCCFTWFLRFWRPFLVKSHSVVTTIVRRGYGPIYSHSFSEWNQLWVFKLNVSRRLL